ncbi:MAG: hypothetical protein HQL37_03140 [Alphaproteobacteria bacterium]|nr:hypothetical protein [Alphaproteobacteria bacterium]
MASVAIDPESIGEFTSHIDPRCGQCGKSAATAQPEPAFFQVFEAHGLDGLNPEDWNDATRPWAGG